MIHYGHIFISYKREDAAIARDIRDALQNHNLDVWWDEKLQTGQKWEATIDEVLRSAAAVLVLWSERSVKSEWVRHEASYAKTSEKLVQARVDDCAVPQVYASSMAADLREWRAGDNSADLAQMVAEINRIVRARASVSRRQALLGTWEGEVMQYEAEADSDGCYKVSGKHLISMKVLSVWDQIRGELELTFRNQGKTLFNFTGRFLHERYFELTHESVAPGVTQFGTTILLLDGAGKTLSGRFVACDPAIEDKAVHGKTFMSKCETQ